MTTTEQELSDTPRAVLFVDTVQPKVKFPLVLLHIFEAHQPEPTHVMIRGCIAEQPFTIVETVVSLPPVH